MSWPTDAHSTSKPNRVTQTCTIDCSCPGPALSFDWSVSTISAAEQPGCKFVGAVVSGGRCVCQAVMGEVSSGDKGRQEEQARESREAGAEAMERAAAQPALTFSRICLGVSSRRSINEASRIGACCAARYAAIRSSATASFAAMAASLQVGVGGVEFVCCSQHPVKHTLSTGPHA